jgi:CHAT domain-containing protein
MAIASDPARKATVIDTYTILTAPSLTAAATSLRRTTASATPPAVTAIINPTGDLNFAEPEGAVAVSYFEEPRRTLLGAKDARLQPVLVSLAKSSHWHFATHGTFSWAKTSESALLLADGDRLTVHDLSACETGVFDFQRTPDEFHRLAGNVFAGRRRRRDRHFVAGR